MENQFEMGNPNDVTPDNDVTPPELKKEEPKPMIRESPAPTPTATRSSKVEITTKNLDEFLADVSRLSEILIQTHESLKSIEKSTAVVQKLQSIADMDLKEFKNKFEDMVVNLDLNQHAKEAVQAALMPLTKEYHDSSVQLKNLIFELEGRILPPEKKSFNFKSLFVIVGLVLVLGVGGFAWFSTQKSGGGEVQNTVSFIIENGGSVVRSDGKEITAKSQIAVKNAVLKNGFYYFKHKDTEFKIPANSIYLNFNQG
ncbi:MAG: hypothetical protein WC665_05565 [Sulfurimonas sp.]|jgi:hypothetical protein